jgi:hypothetical protein
MFWASLALWLTLQSLPVSFAVVSAAGLQHHNGMNKRVNNPAFQMDVSIVTWDPTCAGPSPDLGNGWNGDPGDTKQDFVARAWAGAMELAADAQARFAKTKSVLDKSGNNPPSLADALQVDAFDPA